MNRKINFKKYFYVYLNSKNKYEVITDKYFINTKPNIVPINISHLDIWEKYKVEQYKETFEYEFYEKGSYEEYMGYWVKVNDFVKDYNEDFEYKVKRIPRC